MGQQGCIYIITNVVNNKVYIGQTTTDYKVRLHSHYSKLRNNKHSNDHLQASWNTYGEDNFVDAILEKCDIKDLNRREKFWIDRYNSTNKEFGYNAQSGGQKSYKYTKDVLAKMSKKQRGENNGNSKLTNDDVKNIKLCLLNGNSSNKDIAIKFGVCATTISHIRIGTYWSDIYPELTEKIMNKYNDKENVEIMINNCKTLREELLVYLVCECGIKISQLINLDISNVNFNNNYILLNDGKQTKVDISDNTMLKLWEYVQTRKDNEALFVSYKSPCKRIDSRTMQRDLRNIKALSGL